MTETTYAPGQRVKIVAHNIGTVLLHEPYHFTPYIAGEHDTGEVVTSDGAMPDGWLLVHLDHKDDDGNDLYAPVHPSMIEAA